MEFLKIVGSGNDFVVIDNRKGIIRRREELAKKLCDRKMGIGADGLLLIENSKKADFKMRIFNPDGSEAEMCGNGLRCVFRFLKEKKITHKKSLMIETKAGILDGEIKKGRVKIRMRIIGKPHLNMKIPLEKENIEGHFINTGVPHTVIVVQNIEKVKVEQIGPEIRYHKIFQPEGTNVDWVEIVDERKIKMRTYERGVEGETLSCGTGAVASGIITHLLGYTRSPLSVLTSSGEILKIYFDENLSSVYLEGDTFLSFNGEWIGR